MSRKTDARLSLPKAGLKDSVTHTSTLPPSPAGAPGQSGGTCAVPGWPPQAPTRHPGASTGIDAISRIRQVMEHELSPVIAPLVEHYEDIERVVALLDDEESRATFRREVVFNRLKYLLADPIKAIRYAGNVSQQEWADATARMRAMAASGELPALHFPEGPQWVAESLCASTFVLGQYRHPMVEVPRGCAFIDCGACCGETAVWAVMQGAGIVHAFEPNPEAFRYLKKNAAKFGQGRIAPIPAGVGSAPGRCGMATSEPGNIGSTRMLAGQQTQEKMSTGGGGRRSSPWTPGRRKTG